MTPILIVSSYSVSSFFVSSIPYCSCYFCSVFSFPSGFNFMLFFSSLRGELSRSRLLKPAFELWILGKRRRSCLLLLSSLAL